MSILSFQSYRKSTWHDLYKVSFKSHCPYCNVKIKHLFHASDGGGGSIADFDVWDCPVCGWWEYDYSWISEFSSGPYKANGVSSLKKFEEHDIQLPLDVLRNEITKNKSLLNNINPRKMEELAGAVLKDFLDVEVIHCGASHDRGIDLLILNGDNVIPVQVKRRADQRAVESVRTVREMFGVLYRDSFNQACVISTADHFSNEAIKEVNEVIEKRACEKFDLIDAHKFFSMINATKQNVLPVWIRECSSLIIGYDNYSSLLK